MRERRRVNAAAVAAFAGHLMFEASSAKWEVCNNRAKKESGEARDGRAIAPG
jgi:hypothetical protein